MPDTIQPWTLTPLALQLPKHRRRFRPAALRSRPDCFTLNVHVLRITIPVSGSSSSGRLVMAPIGRTCGRSDACDRWSGGKLRSGSEKHLILIRQSVSRAMGLRLWWTRMPLHRRDATRLKCRSCNVIYWSKRESLSSVNIELQYWTWLPLTRLVVVWKRVPELKKKPCFAVAIWRTFWTPHSIPWRLPSAWFRVMWPFFEAPSTRAIPSWSKVPFMWRSWRAPPCSIRSSRTTWSIRHERRVWCDRRFELCFTAPRLPSAMHVYFRPLDVGLLGILQRRWQDCSKKSWPKLA